MILKEIGILLLDTSRGRAYIQNLIKNKLCPSFAIVLGQKNKTGSVNSKYAKQFFDQSESVFSTLEKNNMKYKKVDATDCNDKSVISELKSRKEKYFIYTGGGILKDEILSIGKKFIHVHPGIVPYYRGSTCMYYSLINEGKIGATAFFLEKNVDTGDIIAQKVYGKPPIQDIDYVYDPYMRSDLLVKVIKSYAKTKKFQTKKQDKTKGETYFIMHPVLKHLAILMCRK